MWSALQSENHESLLCNLLGLKGTEKLQRENTLESYTDTHAQRRHHRHYDMSIAAGLSSSPEGEPHELSVNIAAKIACMRAVTLNKKVRHHRLPASYAWPCFCR